MFSLTEIVHHIFGADNRFGFKYQRRSDDVCSCTERLGNRMDFRLILAISSQAFPNKCNCIQTQTVNSLIGQESDDVDILQKHIGV